MISVASLLNPLPMDNDGNGHLPSPRTDRHSSTDYYGPGTPSSPLGRKPKISKDAPVFARGKVKGDVRFPPYEDVPDERLRQEIERFAVYPYGRITQYPRHIPYNSDKKGFQEKTGRESFEVFQYTFKNPNDGQTYAVIWDYNVGLVRVTPFFKCCKYSKTTPAKMLNSNPGLRDICHSITGGALAAQGYWMPYEAARHLAATFCYRIRYALVPLFGPSFVSFCLHPQNPAYERMIISRDIIKQCTAEAEELRLKGNCFRIERPRPAELDVRVARAPPMVTWTVTKTRAVPEKDYSCSESEYDTESEDSDRCPLFPDADGEAAWRRAKEENKEDKQRQKQGLSFRSRRTNRNLADIQLPPTPTTMVTSTEEPTREKRCLSEVETEEDEDEDEDEDDDEELDSASSDDSSSQRASPQAKRRKSGWSPREAKAAYMLMQLYVADTTKGGRTGERESGDEAGKSDDEQ